MQPAHHPTLQYRSLGSLPDNKLAALKGLEKLQLELDDAKKRLKREQTLVFRKTTKDSFKLGIQQGIGELADAALPFYAKLKPEGIDKLATKVFTIVNTNAFDFMAQYNLTLAGDVQRELSGGIKRTILNGIATGKGAGDIADHGSLTVKQHQTLAKQNGMAIARTKADFIRLLGLKQAELKQAKLLSAQMAKTPPAEGLEGMTAPQLKEMAKENGISLNMTKQETIEFLDKLEPGVDHSGLIWARNSRQPNRSTASASSRTSSSSSRRCRRRLVPTWPKRPNRKRFRRQNV